MSNESSQFAHEARPAAVDAVLVELARRGFIRKDTAARAPAPALFESAQLESRLAGAPFVSGCGLRNLPVLNQLYGAGLGDLAMEVLRAVTAAVAHEADPGARLVRTPGPDLLLLHAGSEIAGVRALALRVREALASVALPAGSGIVHLHPFVASLETPTPWPGSVDELLRTLQEMRSLPQRADEPPPLVAGAQAVAAFSRLRQRDSRLAWVSEALEQGKVEVHFQPVVNLHSGRLEDVEALARVRTPDGLMTASEFIDELHVLGETASLDTQVMRRVGENAHALAEATGRLFVNVSPLSLGSTAFREQMAATIARLRVEGLSLSLVLELTEQALLEHHDVIREIHRVHGVSFAVDDFGTGYSSLRTVSELAVSRVVSVLKIDGSLTRRMTESAEAYKVVLAIAHLAHSLELRVVAEQVETSETLALLRTTGIECGQGYLFDPPLAPEDLLARHGREGRGYADPPARPHLVLLEPYLHRAFESFYERLLADPHFARFFRDPEQVRGLVEKQKQIFVQSLDEDEDALSVRYGRLGRVHADLGIPLATFLGGTDILHEQLLDVLVHATRDVQVLRDTVRFFGTLRGLMARGYVERLVPETRAELGAVRAWAASALPVPPEVRGLLFGCMEGVLDRVAAGSSHNRAQRLPAAPDPACAGATWLDATPVAGLHRQFHSDALSLDYFLAHEDHAAVYPILEGLIGRFQRLLMALARGAGGPSAGL